MTPFVNIALLTSALMLLMLSIPELTVLLAVLWGSSLVVGSLYLSRLSLAVVTMINLVIMGSVTGWETVVSFLALFGASAIVMSFIANSGRGYYRARRSGIITALLGVTILLGWTYYSTGSLGIGEFQQELAKQTELSWQMYEENGLMDTYEERGIDTEDIHDSLLSFVGTIARHLPALYYLQAIMATFFMLILAAIVSQKRNLDRLIRRPFDQEIMPWQMVWVVITGLSLWLWGRDGLTPVYYAGSNLLLITVPIAIYYGSATLVFQVKKYQPGTRRIAAITLIILALVFPVSAVIFLTVIGLFDSLLDYRRLRTKEE